MTLVSRATFALAAAFWFLTAIYGVLASQAFIREQFLQPRVSDAVAAFADWHLWLGLASIGIWIGARLRGRLADSGNRTRWAAIAGSIMTAALLGIAAAAPLSTPSGGVTSRLITFVSLVCLGAASIAEMAARSRASTIRVSRDRTAADFAASVLAAAGMVVTFGIAAMLVDGAGFAAIASGLGDSVRVHFLVAGALFAACTAIRALGSMPSGGRVLESRLTLAAIAAVVAGFTYRVALASITDQGPVALGVAVVFGLAITLALGVAGWTREAPDAGGLDSVMAGLAPALVRRWSGALVWFGVATTVGVGISSASRAGDWNFVVLRTGVMACWLLWLGGAFATTRTLTGGNPAAFLGAAAALLVAHVALDARGVPAGASAVDASARWMGQALTPAAGPSKLFDLAQLHTNVPREKPASPVDISLAPLAGGPSADRPHVFLFVVDSLRRDYLSPYNPAITFTPAIAALAADSLVFERAFTQYGATGLSVPSLWIGAPLLHKQYVTPFAPMNTLFKLVEHEQYAQWTGMDNIMDVILPDSPRRDVLDRGVPVKDFRLCRSLEEIRGRLATRKADEPPVFVYTLPQDIHVSVLSREGAASVDDGAYDGFYAPVASRVRRMDACLGEFVQQLQTSGLYDNSVIVLTADHGDSLGEGGRMGHAYTIYPEVVRVPLIVHVPERIKARWTWAVSAPAYTSDVTPTLYQLLGHPPTPPVPFAGVSLARPLDAAVPADRPRMVASSYGTVYGAVLDNGRRLYVADGIARREMAFSMEDGPSPGTEIPVDARVREQGTAVITDTIIGIARWYRFTP